MPEGRNTRFLALADKINDSKANALVIITRGIDAAAICQQIRKKNSTIQFYGAFWVRTGKIIETGGKSVEGMKIVTPYENKTKTISYNNFQKKYQQLYKTTSSFVGVYTYDAVKVLAYGLKNGSINNSQALKKTILKKSTFEGLEETFSIDRFGDVYRKTTIVEIRNGQFKRLSE